MHAALRRTFATTAATVIATGGLLAVAGAASAEDLAAVAGGCTTTYASDLQYNPYNPKPTYYVSLAGVVTVNASGTVSYVNNDISDTTKYVWCMV